MLYDKSKFSVRRFSHVLNAALLIALCASLLIPSLWGYPTTGIAQKSAVKGHAKKRAEPLPQSKDVPGPNLPDLASIRKLRGPEPQIASPFSPNLACYDCSVTTSSADFSAARVDPDNRIGKSGVDLFSQNLNWSLPVVRLKGRAGLDLDLRLVYNSLVWTKEGSRLKFDADRGSPSPGFRLGFPTIQPRYFNNETNSFAFLMISPSGNRIELRQVGNKNRYESADGSHLQMIDRGENGALLLLPHGGQLAFAWFNHELECTEIKDRNGNFVTARYDERGHLSRIVDTLARTFVFERDNGGNLLSIAQIDGSGSRVLATFGYTSVRIETNFSGLNVVGPTNGSGVVVLKQVGLPSGLRYDFDYTSWGQVGRVTRRAVDGHALSYTSYDLPKDNSVALTDCPRIAAQSNWAEDANEGAETVTRYTVDSQAGWGMVTLPDQVSHKEFFGTEGWRRGLETRTEIWADGILQKWTTVDWMQDDTGLNYSINPRTQERNVYNVNGVRQRTRYEYTDYGLPSDIYEYGADGITVARRNHVDYQLDPAYTNRHLIGLVGGRLIYDQDGKLASKTTYDYDLEGCLADQGSITQHDNLNYGVGLRVGRGLQCSVRHWDATDPDNVVKAIEFTSILNTAGSLIRSVDAGGHATNISYRDNFSDAKERSTFAYPTVVTDVGANQSTAQYDYKTGAEIRTQSASGDTWVRSYDNAGRMTRMLDQTTGAYTRWLYGDDGKFIVALSTSEPGAQESATYTIFDGAGQMRGQAEDLPASAGGFSAQYVVRDLMGREVKWSSPTEITSDWRPTGDDRAGWAWSSAEHDWMSRPTKIINPDGTTREASYSGCGCADGETTTTTDESGRAQKLTKDAFGRLVRVDELNWDGTVYGTTDYAYNALNKGVTINQSGQLRTWKYDGYGRTAAEITPEQGKTDYAYNEDGTLGTITDARGAKRILNYGDRGEIASIEYSAPDTVLAAAAIRFGYDNLGRRKWMEDGIGRTDYKYDARGRVMQEIRRFNDIPGSAYKLGYTYNLNGGLTTLSSSWGPTIGYTRDDKGRLTGVSQGETSLISDIEYRAWGGVQKARLGNGRNFTADYDSRLRLKEWNVEGVFGSRYGYDDSGEGTGRVTRVENLYDRKSDRLFEYDQVGRLDTAYTGPAAQTQNGQNGSQLSDGSDVQQYQYDVWGNQLEKASTGAQAFRVTYTNNRLDRDTLTGNDVEYDRAGNLTSDGLQKFKYDAAGHQRAAKSAVLEITQDYDGNGLRAKKVEGNLKTYYLRSSVLGNQVVADLDASGRVQRSYIYSGSNLLAMNEQSGLIWVHSDPITKSKRLTDSRGRVIGGIEVDPWGNEIGDSFGPTQGEKNTRKFATYERDGNGSDDAMHRRYNAPRGRFDQPDPFRGSMNPSNPQSLNRYSYTANDPVNHTDPSGLMMISCWGWGLDDGDQYGWTCIGYDPWGGYNPDPPPPPSGDPCADVTSDCWGSISVANGFSSTVDPYSAQELNDAAITVFGEISAHVTGTLGAEANAVASVIFNRSSALANGTGPSVWGASSSLTDVVSAPSQFNGFNAGKNILQTGVDLLNGQRNCQRLQEAFRAVADIAYGQAGRQPFNYMCAHNRSNGSTRPMAGGEQTIGGNDFSASPMTCP